MDGRHASTTATEPGSLRERWASLVGMKLAGRYRVVELLARGGMGNVYVAIDERHGTRVALKTLREEQHGTARSLRRELDATRVLTHPHIVQTLDSGVTAEGVDFMVAELVEGRTLADVLRTQGVPPLPWALAVTMQILDALEHAHGHGVVHRDVKPSNCICVGFQSFEQPPTVKLLDFGLAKVRQRAEADASADDTASTARLMGTASYAAPEQAMGATTDARSDLYAVGVVLYELVTGMPPFTGETAVDVSWLHIHCPPPRPSSIDPGRELPRALEAAILRALEKDPARRPANARELASLLSAAPTAANGELADDPTIDSTPHVRATPESWEWAELQKVLRKTRELWIKRVLEPSHEVIAPISQRKTYRPLRSPLDDGTVIELSPSRPATGALERANGFLLILGEAGVGKTTTLLKLVRHACDHATREPDALPSVPVVFALSSWRPSFATLLQWMSSELSRRYLLPHSLASRWLERGWLTPFLDGLDEVRPVWIPRCVDQINHFRRRLEPAGLVVSARTEEYAASCARLELDGVLELHELRVADIQRQLSSPKWQGLRVAMDASEKTRALVQSPLLLQLVCKASEDDLEISAALRAGTLSSERLMARYLDAVTSPRARNDEHGLDLLPRLRSLAQHMVTTGVTLFTLEDLQPAAIRSERNRRHYAVASRVLVGLLFGLSIVLAVGLSPLQNMGFATSLTFAVTLGIASGGLVGLGLGLLAAAKLGSTPVHEHERDGDSGGAQGTSRSQRRALIPSFLVAVPLGLLGGLLADGLRGHPAPAVMGVETGLVLACLLGVSRRRRSLPHDDVSPAERLRWVAAKLPSRPLALTLVSAVVVFSLFSVLDTTATALYSAAAIAVIGVLAIGIRRDVGAARIVPNVGIHQTLRNAVTLGAAAFVVGLVAFGLGYGPGYGACVALTLGTIVFLWFGGIDVLNHVLVRLALAREATLPLRPRPLLDRATALGLMRRVGNGYMFHHRLLLDHLGKPQEARREER